MTMRRVGSFFCDARSQSNQFVEYALVALSMRMDNSLLKCFAGWVCLGCCHLSALSGQNLISQQPRARACTLLLCVIA